jgi:hypothetical protein
LLGTALHRRFALAVRPVRRRRAAAFFACRESARFDAALRGSCFNALRTA